MEGRTLVAELSKPPQCSQSKALTHKFTPDCLVPTAGLHGSGSVLLSLIRQLHQLCHIYRHLLSAYPSCGQLHHSSPQLWQLPLGTFGSQQPLFHCSPARRHTPVLCSSLPHLPPSMMSCIMPKGLTCPPYLLHALRPAGHLSKVTKPHRREEGRRVQLSDQESSNGRCRLQAGSLVTGLTQQCQGGTVTSASSMRSPCPSRIKSEL